MHPEEVKVALLLSMHFYAILAAKYKRLVPIIVRILLSFVITMEFRIWVVLCILILNLVGQASRCKSLIWVQNSVHTLGEVCLAVMGVKIRMGLLKYTDGYSDMKY